MYRKGDEVWYESKQGRVKTKVLEDEEVEGQEYIRLAIKQEAKREKIKRVAVDTLEEPTRKKAHTSEQSPPPSPKKTDGATLPAPTAEGAAAASGASPAASLADVQPGPSPLPKAAVGAQGATAVAEKVEVDLTLPSGEELEAHKLQQWFRMAANRMAQLVVKGPGSAPAEQLKLWVTAELGLNTEAKRFDALTQVIPKSISSGQVNFQSVPQTKKTGAVHVSFLSFEAAHYSGGGLYLQDALTLLQNTEPDVLLKHTISITPIKHTHVASFGWAADGALVNSNYAFVFTFLGFLAYSLRHSDPVPQRAKEALAAVGAIYFKHKTKQEQLVTNLLASETNRVIHRTVQDPLFLAAELSRNGESQPEKARAIFKLYKQRAMINPAFKMPTNVEECSIRFMNANKVAQATKDMLRAVVVAEGWDRCCFTAHILSVKSFIIGAILLDTSHVVLVGLALQSARGQAAATRLFQEQCGLREERMRSSEPGSKAERFENICIAVGMWFSLRNEVFPHLALPEEHIDNLENMILDPSSNVVRQELLETFEKEPAEGIDNLGALASWLAEHWPTLRSLRSEVAKALQRPGASSVTAILSQKEIEEVNRGHLMTSLRMDVNAFRVVDRETQASHQSIHDLWKERRETHVADVKRFLAELQRTDVRMEHQCSQVGKYQGTALRDAVVDARKHASVLQTVHGIDASQMAFLTVLQLNSMGALKTMFLHGIKQFRDSFPGLILIFYPRMPRSGRSREVRANDEEESAATEDSSDEENLEAHAEDLPQAFTKMSTPKHQNPIQAQAALASDHFTIERSLCDQTGPLRYARRISFVLDTNETVHGLLLAKTEADEQELDEDAVLMSSGIFTDLKTDESVIVNRKAAVSANKAYQQGYAWEPETTKTKMRLRKSQLGASFHHAWLLDTMQHCKRKIWSSSTPGAARQIWAWRP